ncbi:MAG: sulfatase, partial [Planctomycetota bacterium]
AEEPRTVVLVTSDTHRADHLRAGRDSVDVQTPFLDGLAARGVLFEDCFASTNITLPSHAALLTGTSPRDSGIVDNITALADGAETLAERFQAAGFTTLAVVSARHLRDAQSGLGQGFDRMLAPASAREVDSSITVDRLLESLPGLEGRSLFLWLHVFDAHAPYDSPETFRDLYYPAGRDRYDASLPPLKRNAQLSWDPEVRDPAWARSQYKAEVTYLDSQLERALSHPRFETALLAVTADHGESLGEHGIYFKHHGLFPNTLWVPLILVAPGVPAGVRVTSPVRQLDLGRTLLDLSGLGAAVFPGENLLRWTEPDLEAAAEPRFALSSHALAASLEQDGWFLSLRIVPSVLPRRVAHQVELYYLPDDRGCENDLVESHHERAREMRARLIEWLNAPRVMGMQRDGANRAADLAQLAELGYSDGQAPIPEDRPWYEPDPRSAWVRRFE